MTTGIGRSTRLLVLDSGSTGVNGPARDLIDDSRFAPSSLAGAFCKIAQERWSAPAVISSSRSWSYAELLQAAQRIGAALQQSPGYSLGAKIVLLLPNSFDYIAAFYGTLLAGGVVVPLPPAVEDQTFERICDSVETSVVIASHEARRLPGLLQNVHRERISLFEHGAADENGELPSVSPGDHDLAAIFFTSGSTGDPKGVMLSHRNLISNATSIQQYLEIRQSDRPLCLLPFYHAFGNSVLQSHLLAGGTLVLDGKTLFPETILTAINQHQVNSLSGVPDLFRLLLERTSLGKTSLPTMRYMAVAGGSLPLDLAREVDQRISPAKFYVMYGQTEATARLAYVPPEFLGDIHPGCIGRAIPGVELQIVGDDGLEVSVGETGELCARGENVMLGYWNDPQATADRLRDGWLLTGDLASIDEHGWIYHRGRRNAIIKIAGFRVHPGDLEEFACRRLSVEQAVVVPFEQPQVGTRLALFCRSPSTELTVPEMIARCREELPRHLVPSLIHQLDQFPLNHALKIDRMHLTRMAERELSKSPPRMVPDPSTVIRG